MSPVLACLKTDQDAQNLNEQIAQMKSKSLKIRFSVCSSWNYFYAALLSLLYSAFFF